MIPMKTTIKKGTDKKIAMMIERLMSNAITISILAVELSCLGIKCDPMMLLSIKIGVTFADTNRH